MNFSFCITSDLSSLAKHRLSLVIESIRELKIPNYEILIIGESRTNIYDKQSDIKLIRFTDATPKKRWITRKKNILSQLAQYNNIVMMHDYFVFDNNWYKNYLSFDHAWDICSNAQLLENNSRHWLDWTVWDDPLYERYTGLCYDNWNRTKYMYVSGAYYLIKKDVAIENPLNESLMWGQGEDVEWSLKIRNKYRIVCNAHSIVKHCKPHRDLNYTNYKLEDCSKNFLDKPDDRDTI
jgi:hypothetical protein